MNQEELIKNVIYKSLFRKRKVELSYKRNSKYYFDSLKEGRRTFIFR